MIRWNNDYNRIADEKVLQAVMATAAESFAGYGTDVWCEKAAEMIRKAVNSPKAAVHFLPGATQVNFIVTQAILSPVQSVICADTGHIFCHEAGSIENTGHKLLYLPNTDGKITAAQIEEEAQKYYNGGEPEYLTEPHMVYISFTTEAGTLYTLEELKSISAVCRKYGMLFFVDGARLAYGLGAEENDVTLEDFAALTDAFFLGGTKCGAMFGEALVILNEGLKYRFKAHMKQNGAVMAKGWLMGVQFCALMEDDRYVELGRKADAYAMQIREAFRKKGIKEAWVSPTNQQFVILTKEQKEVLAKDFTFEEEGECVRFCTSWATTQEETDALVKAIEAL